MVLQHYKHCAFKRKSQLGSEESLVKQDCKVCGQLIRIVALHSKTDCKVTAGVVTVATLTFHFFTTCHCYMAVVEKVYRICSFFSDHACVMADIGCPVLMCDTFRMVAKRNRVAKVNETSSRVPSSSAIRRAGPKAAQPVSSSWNKCSPEWWPVLKSIVFNSLELILAQTPAIHVCLKCSSLWLALVELRVCLISFFWAYLIKYIISLQILMAKNNHFK